MRSSAHATPAATACRIAAFTAALLAISSLSSRAQAPDDANPVVLTLEHDADFQTTATGRRGVVAFRVSNPSGEVQTGALDCFIEGAMSTCAVASPAVTVKPGQWKWVIVRYQAGAEAGIGQLALRASTPTGAASASVDVLVQEATGEEGELVESAASEVQLMAAGAGSADVWFLDDTVTVEPNTPDAVAVLMVKNTGSTSLSVSLSCTRTGSVSSCSLLPSSVLLEPFEQRDVTAAYATGAVGTGTVRISGGGDSDTLVVLVQTPSTTVPGPPVVSSATLNPASLLERSLCVTSGAGPAGAFQCAELLMAHAIPAYRSMNRDRTLTLLYNSGAARPTPVIMADVSLSAQITVPQTVSVAVWLNGTYRKTVSYDPTGLSPGGPAQRIAIPVEVTEVTGAYPYALHVTNQYSGSSHTTISTGEVIIVNRSVSPYGAGWSVAGVEQVVGHSGLGRRLVSADGSMAYYAPLVTNKWLAPAGEYRDTLVLGGDTDPSGAAAQYWRRLLNGTKIYYDANGRQTWVKDRDGNLVQYSYGTHGGLSSVRISPYAQNKTYTFIYDASSKLDYITDPAGRVLQVTVSGGNLVNLRNPGAPVGKETVFGYTSNRMTSRRSPEGHTTQYAYFSGTSMLERTTLPATAAGTGVVLYKPAQSRGLAMTTSGNSLYASVGVTAEVNGARTDVSDVATFWVNGYGAPVRTRDPALANTYLRYSALHPLLVDSVTYANGRAIRMTYDGRARLTKSEDLTHSSGIAAVATYSFTATSSAPESPNMVILPNEGSARDTTAFTYVAGRLTQIVDPRGHATTYSYNAAGQVLTAAEKAVTYWAGGNPVSNDSLVSRIYYNTLGNIDSVRTPMNHATRYRYDSSGNTIWARDAVGDSVKYSYTLLNLQDSIIQFDSTGTYKTRITYDHDGNRKTLCDPRNVCRNWSYDALGRVLSMTDEFGYSDLNTYDLAGNVTRYRNRQGDTIRTTYDAMNRPTTQLVGQVKVESAETGLYGQLANTVLVPADTRQFAYDVMGRLTRAENAVAITWRDYTKEGAVSRDSQHVKVSPVTKRTLRYTYHPSNARKSMQTPARTYTYAYAKGGLLDRITWGTNERVSFTYDGLGRRVGASALTPAGVTVANTEYRLDKDGRLYRILTTRPGTGGKTLVDMEYTTLDKLGRPLLMTDRSPMTDTATNIVEYRSFAYDGRGQMIRQGTWRNIGGGTSYVRHRYDGSGNRTWQYSHCTLQWTSCVDTVEFVYYPGNGGSSNRLGGRFSWRAGESSAYEQHTYHYDQDGNSTVDEWGERGWTGPIYLYRYHSADARLQATRPTSVTANLRFLYDALGRRQRGAFGDSTSLFFYDGENTVQYGFATFLPGPGVDEPLVAFFGSGNPCPGINVTTTNGYFTTNANRLLDAYADGSGQHSCFNHNPWGWVEQSGTIMSSESFDLERTPGTGDGLSFFRNRFYDPKMGRFTQEDPIGYAGGLNLYAYAGNNPATFTDPFGLCPWPPSSCFSREGADLAVGFAPGVSTVHDVSTALTGRNIVTGEDVGLVGRGVALAGALSPLSGPGIRSASNLIGDVASGIANRIGRNSVSIRTSGGVKRVDLQGRAHGGMATPHVQEYRFHTNPLTGQVNSSRVPVRPATWQDLREVERILRDQGR